MTVAGAFDAVLGAVERPLVRALRLENRYPPLFILGAPRSGTTVVYQYVVHGFRLAYFPNLSRRLPRACVTAAAVARAMGDPPVSFESRFGEIRGANAPSDGWEVFHRWFPRYDYSVPVRTDRLHELRTIVRLLEVIHDAPFANKNNSTVVRIDHLADLFPDALFLHVERDLPTTVASIVRGRAANEVGEDEWWGAPPPRTYAATFDSELDRVVAQVSGLRRAARDALSAVPGDRHTTVSYERFCREPRQVLAWVREAYAGRGVELEARDVALPTDFDPRGSLEAGLRDRILELAAEKR